MSISSIKVPKTIEEFKAVDRALMNNGIFRKFPLPGGSWDPLSARCANLWRGVLDLVFLEIMRGPTPLSGSATARQRKATERNYRGHIHWLYSTKSGPERSDFEEVCDLANLCPVMVKQTITRFTKQRRLLGKPTMGTREEGT